MKSSKKTIKKLEQIIKVIMNEDVIQYVLPMSTKVIKEIRKNIALASDFGVPIIVNENEGTRKEQTRRAITCLKFRA